MTKLWERWEGEHFASRLSNIELCTEGTGKYTVNSKSVNTNESKGHKSNIFKTVQIEIAIRVRASRSKGLPEHQTP